MRDSTEYVALIIFSIFFIFAMLVSLYLWELVFDECKAGGNSDVYCMKVAS